MNRTIEEYLNNGAYDKLRYLFANAFDVDPTFESYRADYEVCKDKVLQPHEELTPFSNDYETWKTARYWGQLKIDLNKNFSEQRFHHLQEVAEVYLSDRIAEIRRKQEAEAEAARKAAEAEAARKAAEAEAARKAAAAEAARKAAAQQRPASPTVTQSPKSKAPGQETHRETTLVESPEQKRKREAQERRNLLMFIAAIAAVVLLILILILSRHQ